MRHKMKLLFIYVSLYVDPTASCVALGTDVVYLYGLMLVTLCKYGLHD